MAAGRVATSEPLHRGVWRSSTFGVLSAATASASAGPVRSSGNPGARSGGFRT